MAIPKNFNISPKKVANIKALIGSLETIIKAAFEIQKLYQKKMKTTNQKQKVEKEVLTDLYIYEIMYMYKIYLPVTNGIYLLDRKPSKVILFLKFGFLLYLKCKIKHFGDEKHNYFSQIFFGHTSNFNTHWNFHSRR